MLYLRLYTKNTYITIENLNKKTKVLVSCVQCACDKVCVCVYTCVLASEWKSVYRASARMHACLCGSRGLDEHVQSHVPSSSLPQPQTDTVLL